MPGTPGGRHRADLTAISEQNSYPPLGRTWCPLTDRTGHLQTSANAENKYVSRGDRRRHCRRADQVRSGW